MRRARFMPLLLGGGTIIGILLAGCSSTGEAGAASGETQFATWDDFVAASDQVWDDRARCMTERGFETRHLGGGAFTTGMDVIVNEAFEAAEAECDRLHPGLGANSVMSAAAWTRFYMAVVEHARCREDFGIAMAAQPPSIQTLVDWAMANDAIWGPWDGRPAQWDPLLESQALEVCGQEPWITEFIVE